MLASYSIPSVVKKAQIFFLIFHGEVAKKKSLESWKSPAKR